MVAAVARLPLALNTVVAIAIPNTAPNCCMVFITPAVNRPLQDPDVAAEVAMDGRQRGHHDQGVERHHEVRHRGEQHGQDLA
jgi:hypothetical protein